MDIPPKVNRAYRSRQVYDGLCQGADGQNLSRQTAAYALRACGTVAQHNFPHPAGAPEASVAAIDTWYSFTFNGSDTCTFDVPWLHQSQHLGIQGIVRIITRTNVPLRVRLQSDDLVDAVATSNGIGVAAPLSGRSAFLSWRVTAYIGSAASSQGFESPAQRWQVGTHHVRLNSPTLPANRRIAVKPQVQLSGNANVLANLGRAASVFVESMTLRDRVDPDTHE